MSFSLAPSKKLLASDQLAVLFPEWKSEFTYNTRLPDSLLTLCSGNRLLHIHTNYTEADSVLNLKTPQPAQVQVINIPPADEGATWLTLLDVDPKAYIYALLSNTGTLLFIRLRVKLVASQATYEASVFKRHLLGTDCQCKKGISLCLDGLRFFMFQNVDRQLLVVQCDVVSYKIKEPQNMSWVIQQMLRDYGTENNILGCKHNVVCYKEDPIATVPKGYQVVSVFGIQCDAFQLLIHNPAGGLEWWRWTGSECEAVICPFVPGVPIGNLLWF